MVIEEKQISYSEDKLVLETLLDLEISKDKFYFYGPPELILKYESINDYVKRQNCKF